MTCEFITDLIPIYADNAASEQTRLIVEKHIKSCPSCRRFLASCKRAEKKRSGIAKNRLDKIKSMLSDRGEETISSVDAEFARLSSRLKKRKRRRDIIGVAVLSAMTAYIIFDVVRAIKKPKPEVTTK